MSDDKKTIVLSGLTKCTADSVEDKCRYCETTIYHDGVEFYERNGITNPEFICLICATTKDEFKGALCKASVLPETLERVALLIAGDDKKVH
jgi:hypothetical protein